MGFAAGAGFAGVPFAMPLLFDAGAVAAAFGFNAAELLSAGLSPEAFLAGPWLLFTVRSDFFNTTAYLFLFVPGSQPVSLAGATRLLAEQRHFAIKITRRLDSRELFDDLGLVTRKLQAFQLLDVS